MAIDAGDTQQSNAEMANAQPVETSGSGALVPVPSSAPLHQMHDGRVVSHAGRMVAGALVPVPTVKPSRRRSNSGGWKTTAGIVFAAFIFTFGATSLITGYLQQKNNATMAAHATTGEAVNSAATQAPVQTLALSEIGDATSDRKFINSPLHNQRLTPNSPMPRRASNLTVKNIVGASGRPLPMHLSVERGQVEKYTFVMFRGVPKNVKISAGFRVKKTWAVALQDLEQLTLTTPAGFQGTFNLDVVLIKGQNTPAEKRRMAVTIGKSNSVASTANAQPKIITASVQPQGKSAKLSRSSLHRTPRKRRALKPKQEQAILNKAAILINANDVASARLLFEYAANRGSAKAALAMGQTFDPAFFRAAEIIGLRPNPQKAIAWYQKAAALGNKEAQKRLSSLQTR
ncbi:MAG: hypothetical protein P8Y67_12345 [Alphaproteobacteria bacterium]